MFMTELSDKLAERYQRPLSSIAVHVSHSQCIFYAGTFEPAYVATVSALAPYVQPATNRRNAHVLSEHLEEALGVPAPRGHITFVALPEENVACNGKTMAQALDEAVEGGGSHAMGVIQEERTRSPGFRRKRLSVKVGKDLLHNGTLGERHADPHTVALEPQDNVDVGCWRCWRADTPNQRRGHAGWQRRQVCQGGQAPEELHCRLVRKVQPEGE